MMLLSYKPGILCHIQIFFPAAINFYPQNHGKRLKVIWWGYMISCKQLNVVVWLTKYIIDRSSYDVKRKCLVAWQLLLLKSPSKGGPFPDMPPPVVCNEPTASDQSSYAYNTTTLPFVITRGVKVLLPGISNDLLWDSNGFISSIGLISLLDLRTCCRL